MASIYHYTPLTYHRTVIMSYISFCQPPPYGVSPQKEVSPFHDVNPQRGYLFPFYDISHPLDSTFHNDPLLHLTLGSNFFELLLVAILNPNHVTHQFHGLTHLAGWC